MTKKTMIKHYRNYSAADSYIVGFTFNKMLYFVELAEIAPRFLNVEQASRNQGENLRLRLRKNHKAQLMKKILFVSVLLIYLLLKSIIKVKSLKNLSPSTLGRNGKKIQFLFGYRVTSM